MRDIDIRLPLKGAVAREFRHDSLIIEEMVIPGRNARIDVAVINGELHGFEIKSGSDTLKRLPSQRDAYNSIFDKITLILENYHAGQTLPIPEWWGACTAHADGDDVQLEIRRPPMANADVDVRILVRLLWRDEVVGLLESSGVCNALSKLYIYELHQLLIEAMSRDELKAAVRSTLKTRPNWRVDSLRT